MLESIDIRLLLSGVSFLVTTWFWFVKARKDKPCLAFHQLADFRVFCRRHPERSDRKRLCVQQLDTGGVLIVNHSTRQNSVVLFQCFLKTKEGTIEGDWGYSGDDKPPWNVGPETSIAFSPACFFDVPENYEVPENLKFRIRFVTASGKNFSHTFSQRAPRLTVDEDVPVRRAA